MHQLRRALAGLLAVAALVLALRPVPTSAGSSAPAVPTDSVVVAAADLPAGTVLGPEDVTVRSLPAELVPGSAVSDPEEVRGVSLASAVRAGEVLTDARLVGAGLWSQVPAGHVAAPVRLADLAVAALLRSGDRVDVLAARPGVPTEVVVDDAVVLAVPAPVTDAALTGGDTAGLVVLAVVEGDAGRLAAASAEATLTVTLGPP
ncbi:MAG: Flp pilus assembly protein CpaB, domain [Klenkia sp.]|nr:Flp pilus assembly protein CpaB, domain [Klenkia sp.]